MIFTEEISKINSYQPVSISEARALFLKLGYVNGPKEYACDINEHSLPINEQMTASKVDSLIFADSVRKSQQSGQLLPSRLSDVFNN
ncbi:hypothetical protein [Capybara microvirus Cap1_SP_115]|nr:hypothetical protein [Capybara microvirus Cap1_SP_115]